MKMTGKNQKDFAEELCIAPATLSGIFKGTTRPSNNIVSSIHERFPEISIPWLMFGEGEMYVASAEPAPNAPQEPVSAPSADGQTGTPVQMDLFATTPSAAPVQTALREKVKFIDKPQRKITEIRVFFDDGTYETFTC